MEKSSNLEQKISDHGIGIYLILDVFHYSNINYTHSWNGLKILLLKISATRMFAMSNLMPALTDEFKNCYSFV